MKSLILAFMAVSCFSGGLAYSQEGILPGEPDPNTSPRHDANQTDQHDRALVDDRSKCADGMRRFQKMKCGSASENKDCENYSPVLECRKKPQVLKCKKPLLPVPVYRCE